MNKSEDKLTHFQKYRKLYIGLAILLLLVLLIYFYTYFFANKNNKVIYQDTARRIYLTEKKAYGNKGREMWRMVYEDQKTGKRFFVLGNSKKGYSEKKMVKILLNTIDQKQTKSFDQVESVGVTMKEAKSDIHSNNVKKGPDEVFDNIFDTDFELSI